MSPGRGELAEALRRSARQASAADTLWACGRRAEALRLAAAAFGVALEAHRRGEASLAGIIADKERRRIEAAADAVKLPLPLLEDELEDMHTRLFEAWRRAREVLEGALVERSVEAAAVRRERRLSWIAAVLFGLGAALLGAWTWAFLPEAIEVRASGYRVLQTVQTWPPENIIDRDEMTYWHLPPGETGMIELRFGEPRDVRAVRLLNAHDLHADNENRKDRRRFGHASRDIVIRAFAGDRLIAEAEATLAQVVDWRRETIEIEAPGADRIRIEVTSFYGEGGGLAEVEVLQ